MKLFFKLFTSFHAFVYRRSGGRIMGKVQGMPIMLLNTVGRKSGKARMTPLAFVRDGDAYVIAASNAGQDHHPGWWWNLQHTPNATIELGKEKVAVVAEQAEGADVERLWAKLVEMGSGYASYKEKTSREIPVIILRPTK